MLKLIWSLFLFTSFLIFGENEEDINLTQEEMKWIKQVKEKIVDTFDFDRRTNYEEVLEYTRDKLDISREIEEYPYVEF